MLLVISIITMIIDGQWTSPLFVATFVEPAISFKPCWKLSHNSVCNPYNNKHWWQQHQTQWLTTMILSSPLSISNLWTFLSSNERLNSAQTASKHYLTPWSHLWVIPYATIMPTNPTLTEPITMSDNLTTIEQLAHHHTEPSTLREYFSCLHTAECFIPCLLYCFDLPGFPTMWLLIQQPTPTTTTLYQCHLACQTPAYPRTWPPCPPNSQHWHLMDVGWPSFADNLTVHQTNLAQSACLQNPFNIWLKHPVTHPATPSLWLADMAHCPFPNLLSPFPYSRLPLNSTQFIVSMTQILSRQSPLSFQLCWQTWPEISL